MSETTIRTGRLTRHEWLALALDVLSEEGGARLNIAPLCSKLGVTKGSFYAHFKSQADFVSQLLDYWEKMFTQNVIDTIDKHPEEAASKRLLILMEFVSRNNMSKYDNAFRAWASQNSAVSSRVDQVYNLRLEYVRNLFREIGSSGAELEIKARLFVVYHSSENGIRLPNSDLDLDEELKLRHKFFVQPIAK